MLNAPRRKKIVARKYTGRSAAYDKRGTQVYSTLRGI